MVLVRQLCVAQIRYQLVLSIVVYYHDVPIFYTMCIQDGFVMCDSFLNRQDMYEAYLKKKVGGEG